MLTGESHYGFDLGAGQGATENGHGSLAVDHGGHAEFLVNVARGAEAGNPCSVGA
jgi:hypothetical protein